MRKQVQNTFYALLISAGAFAQNVNIPDANFKAYLVGESTINTNGDAEIQVTEATAYTGQINCPNLFISDLTGIEAFTSLTGLLCGNNLLSSLNVSQNPALTILQCQNNNLSTLDVTNNTALSNFVVVSNNLFSLDLSQNSNLYLLSCSDNNLTTLDVSNNTDLGILICSHNILTSLDVSNNTQLQNLNCANNNLTTLNLKNLNSTTLTSFDATNNSNLECIEVDDVADATANWTNIDATASYSLSCSGVGLMETNLDSSISIYPNPAINQISILGLTKSEQYQIINTQGEVLKSGEVNDLIKISELASGVYFLKVESHPVVRFVKE